MKIPFFHDRDYQGYFGILDGTGRDVLYVSDEAVADCDDSISKALEEHGIRLWLPIPTSYQRKRISTILS